MKLLQQYLVLIASVTLCLVEVGFIFFTITAQILARSLGNFYTCCPI